MIEWNDADPRQRAWAEQEMNSWRRTRIAEGYDAICLRCQQQGPRAWMVNGVCGPNLLSVRDCQPPTVSVWCRLWRKLIDAGKAAE